MGQDRRDCHRTERLRCLRGVEWQLSLVCTNFYCDAYCPQEWVTKESPFTFVTDGVESAIEQAKQVAVERNVSVGGSKIVQQCLQAGLLDERQIGLAPILLGAGIRLFEHLGTKRIDLESTEVIEGTGLTHLRFQ